MFGSSSGNCTVCGTPTKDHKPLKRSQLPGSPKPPELIEINGETWVLCFIFRFFMTIWYGVPVADADPDLVDALQRNTMTLEEFEELYQ